MERAICPPNGPFSTINAVYVGGPCHPFSHAGAASSRCSSALFIFYSLGTIIKTPAAIHPYGKQGLQRAFGLIVVDNAQNLANLWFWI